MAPKILKWEDPVQCETKFGPKIVIVMDHLKMVTTALDHFMRLAYHGSTILNF